MMEGLKPGQRQYVHLSDDMETAESVGKRYGSPIVLTVASREMHDLGYIFYLSTNNVWLAENIPADFLAYKLHTPHE